jgi:RND family efflux transporter MFP subunit
MLIQQNLSSIEQLDGSLTDLNKQKIIKQNIINIMKRILMIFSVASIIASCGGGNADTNKEAELDELLRQRADLDERIKLLKEELGSDASAGTARLVRIEKLSTSEFNHYVEVQARVDGDDAVNIGPRTQGTVQKIHVKEGDQVKAGQVLAQLDDQLVQQNLAEVQTQYDFAKTIYEKRKALWEQKIGTELEYLTAKNNYESLGKRMAAAREQLDMTRIKAPLSGTVDNVDLKLGQSVMPGMPVIRVVNLSNLKVKGEVAESYAGSIKQGDDVILYFPDLRTEVNSTVSYASQVIDKINRTFNVEVPLEDDEGRFKPNMVVVMKISDYNNPEAYTLPADLVQLSRNGQFVMVAESKGDRLFAKRKEVTTGKSYNGVIEIMSGLDLAEKVITNGYRDLNEGAELRIN